MIRFIGAVFCLILLTACPKKELLERKPVLNSYLINTCEFGYKRYFLMVTRFDQNLDSLKLSSALGKGIKLFDENLEPDSCPKIMNMQKVNLLIPTKIHGEDYCYLFGGQGMIIYQNPYCSKQEDLANQDSFECDFMVFDLEIDTITAELNIWRSIDSIGWWRDSIPWRKIKLREICSREEIEEQKKFIQALYEKHTEVDVSPNPFKESFKFKMKANFMSYSFVGKTIMLKFMDENGKVYLERQIEEGMEYEFSLPEFPKGKIVYYTISWEDYQLSGQFMKSI